MERKIQKKLLYINIINVIMSRANDLTNQNQPNCDTIESKITSPPTSTPRRARAQKLAKMLEDGILYSPEISSMSCSGETSDGSGEQNTQLNR